MARNYVGISMVDRIAMNAIEDENGCWIWQSTIHPQQGYGRIWADGRPRNAHRISYTAFIGSIPVGLQIDHLCRVRACVNPWHLEPVTPRVNTLRGNAPNIVAARENRCTKGHAYTPENTRFKADGCRACRTCFRLYYLRYRGRVCEHTKRFEIDPDCNVCGYQSAGATP